MTKNITEHKVKTHLIFPSDIIETIDKIIGKRKRSKFVVEATRRELKRISFMQALHEAAGSWNDKKHPDIRLKGTYKWVRDQRQKQKILK